MASQVGSAEEIRKPRRLQELVGLSAQALSNRICSKIVLQLFRWQSLTTGRSVYSPGIRIGMLEFPPLSRSGGFFTENYASLRAGTQPLRREYVTYSQS